MLITEIRERKIGNSKINEVELENRFALDQIRTEYEFRGFRDEYFRLLLTYLDAPSKYTYKQLSDLLVAYKRNLLNKDNYYNSIRIKQVLTEVEKLGKDLKTILAYIEAFETAGTDAQAVFLRLMEKTSYNIGQRLKI